jgi:hypothetical protein
MNPNDLIAQQQAVMNQLAQNSQQMMWGMLAVQVALLILGAWVTYMFYARLRDIGDELRKIRVMYEMAQEREARRLTRAASSTQSEPPSTGESRYMPKP